MAIYRNIQLSFWTDNKVEDDFTPEDKYFYLYLLTNPQTNLCGCYEVSYSQMTNQTGYNRNTINRLLSRLETVHGVIRYNKGNKEVLILNWYKYNWSKSEKTLVGVENVAKFIKTDDFRGYVFYVLDCIRNNKQVILSQCPIRAVEAVDSSLNSDCEDDTTEICKKIIDYLNSKCNTKYRYNADNTKKHIGARLKEHYTLEDFYTVIDKKYDEWVGTEREKFLRPDTLFGSKFESYLNQKIIKGSGSDYIDKIQRRVREVDNWT